ncbi:cell wall synthase accessory phosphoprotein MacP [Vagococcus intermedius]|uniref:Cell wall synthase accessory phosphoprotein MacP n=1 Tax=Vagococcus intermedius TaxID=2991418 RepID=A0AAF0CUB8_9ENTE|nr:cell wall synthase accessory phosphoprotein MacP [Vagococcus intermedius]WEG73143.1 cell wall synthase accessory phosphoprotein MacP [Vagococcus intermedius]WEG75227.1 cell wall synthase accessory phosphoprotein MacP [Vagococcus intermedius]
MAKEQPATTRSKRHQVPKGPKAKLENKTAALQKEYQQKEKKIKKTFKKKRQKQKKIKGSRAKENKKVKERSQLLNRAIIIVALLLVLVFLAIIYL